MTAPEAQPTGDGEAKKPLTAREKAKLNHVPLHDPLIGQVIGGHYEVVECIGKGGMSVVYKCRHQLINQFRAVKVLLPHRDAAADFLLRFQLEATAASRLDNKHIVKVHDFVAPEASAPYLVMDYAEGQGLGDEIDKLGRLPVKRSLAIFVQILDAMGHTHARGVIHRDLKPDNILLVNDDLEGPDFVKLIDFGIAKLTAADKQQPQGLTPTGEVFGSPQYMSPEQCAGLTMDVRSEIYSLGCILYEMLSGRPPLLGQSVLETLNMQAHTPATPLAKLPLEPPVKLPDGLDDILMRCLAKKPGDRFQSTDDLRKALTKLPLFDRRSRISPSIFSQAGAPALGLAALALLVSFGLGFGVAKLIPVGNQLPKDASSSDGASKTTGPWESLYISGQKALDDGDLAVASTKLEEALSIANSLDDGQKRAAATGQDLEALHLIKQFKNIGPNQGVSQVTLSQAYTDNPWDTKISTITELLRSKPENAEEEKAIFRATVSLLEDSHKGNLSSLDDLLKLAQGKLFKYESLSARDKLRLAILIAGVEEERGLWKRARNALTSQAVLLADLGGSDSLTARFYLLTGRLAVDENDYDEAKKAAVKAQSIYDENAPEHTTDLLEVALLHSDIALLHSKYDDSLKLAKQALASIDGAPASERLEVLKDKLFMRAAMLDPTSNLKAALAQCQTDLDHEETLAPKEVAHLITALSMSYYLSEAQNQNQSGQNQNGKNANSARPKMWRAMALAFANGRLATASSLMQPLMVSYDSPLTQKDLLKIASNRLAIDEALSAAGNRNVPTLQEDYVVLSEALEDFSLGPERNLKKARAYLEKATELLFSEENNRNHLVVARVYYDQARIAQEHKDRPDQVKIFLENSKRELVRLNKDLPDKQQQLAALALSKKVKDLDLEFQRSLPH